MNFTGRKPNHYQVLARILQKQLNEKKKLMISINETTEEIFECWMSDFHKICLQNKSDVVVRLKKLYNKYLKLKKQPTKRRSDASFKIKECEFEKCSKKIFDIEKKKNNKLSSNVLNFIEPQPTFASPTNSVASQTNLNFDSPTFSPPKKKLRSRSSTKTCTKVTPKNLLNCGLTSSLDRSNISNRQATVLVASTMAALGHDPGDCSIGKDTIRRHRNKNRKLMANSIKSQFNTNEIFTIHWDGKLLYDEKENQKVERLAVAVTSDAGNSKILGIPKIKSSTGECQAKGVHNEIISWCIEERVRALCFDTTASNTGRNKGACTLIEAKLNRQLVWNACRHHVLERVAASSFEVALKENSKGPEIEMFADFRKKFKSFDVNNIRSGIQDPEVKKLFPKRVKESIVEFLKNQLKIQNKRDDYKDFVILCLMFLGKFFLIWKITF